MSLQMPLHTHYFSNFHLLLLYPTFIHLGIYCSSAWKFLPSDTHMVPLMVNTLITIYLNISSTRQLPQYFLFLFLCHTLHISQIFIYCNNFLVLGHKDQAGKGTYFFFFTDVYPQHLYKCLMIK